MICVELRWDDNPRAGNMPLSTSKKLSAYKESPLETNDATQYKSIVGVLQYLTLTRRFVGSCMLQRQTIGQR